MLEGRPEIKPTQEIANKAAEDGGISAEKAGIEEKELERIMKRINREKKLKKTYDSWFGRVDKEGNDMQVRLLKFLAENPNEDPVYRPATDRFERARMEI